MFNTRLFRSPDGDAGLGPSLADLDNPAPISGGDGTPKPPVLTEAEQAAANTAAAEQARLAADAAAEAAKTEADKAAADAAADEPADEGETTPEEFYAAAAKYSGIDVKVEFPEGIDPLSPEGVAIRDKVLVDKGVQDFDAHLRTTAPRAYAYFLHQQAGGSDEEFFGNRSTGYTLPDRATLADSVDAQTAIYKYQLRSQGLDEEIADAVVQKAIKDNKLSERASAAYGTIESAQAKQLADAEAAVKAEEAAFRTTVARTEQNISKQIDNLSFVVPPTQKAEFQKYVMDNLRIMDGKVYVVQELAEETTKVQLEALLLQQKKGDLSAIIQKAATTKATQRLRTQIRQSQTGAKKDEGIGGSGAQSLPLSAF